MSKEQITHRTWLIYSFLLSVMLIIGLYFFSNGVYEWYISLPFGIIIALGGFLYFTYPIVLEKLLPLVIHSFIFVALVAVSLLLTLDFFRVINIGTSDFMRETAKFIIQSTFN